MSDNEDINPEALEEMYEILIALRCSIHHGAMPVPFILKHYKNRIYNVIDVAHYINRNKPNQDHANPGQNAL